MIKKLMVLLFCLTIITGITCAQQRTLKAKQNTVTRQVAAKVSNAAFENSLKVTLRLMYKTYEEDHGRYIAIDNRETICSAVIINPQGDLAIKHDCEEPLLLTFNDHTTFHLVADMDNLGHGADRFKLWCEIENINRKLIVDKEIFISFPLRKELSASAERKLKALFQTKGIKHLDDDDIVRILSTMPKAKTIVWEMY